MTLLAMLRHGRTQWSAEKRIQGRTDVPLDTEGRRAIAGLRIPPAFDHLAVASSPLLRCVETARLLGLEQVALEPRIAEMSWGDWEGRRLPELRAELGDGMAANEARGFDFTPPGGESPRRVLERITPWLVDVAASGQATLAVAHRGVIRVVFAQATGWDMLGKPPARLDWDALHLFRLDRAGMPSVVQLNVPLVPVVPLPAGDA